MLSNFQTGRQGTAAELPHRSARAAPHPAGPRHAAVPAANHRFVSSQPAGSDRDASLYPAPAQAGGLDRRSSDRGERLRRRFRVHRGNPSPHQSGLQPAPARGVLEREARPRCGGRRDGRARRFRRNWEASGDPGRSAKPAAGASANPPSAGAATEWDESLEDMERTETSSRYAATDTTQLLARVSRLEKAVTRVLDMLRRRSV